MASASRALLRSLLRQSDRHPIGRLDGVDLEGADLRLVERLLMGDVEHIDIPSAGNTPVLRCGKVLVLLQPDRGHFGAQKGGDRKSGTQGKD